jgi:hypothetical protein
MNRIPVSSSDVASVGYDSEAGVLEVEFHSGGLYQYFDVPENHFFALTSGTVSVGRYLHGHIKDHYRFQRIA